MSAICWYPGQWWGTYRQARSQEWLQEHRIERVITCAIDGKELEGIMENLGIDWFGMDWRSEMEYPGEADWVRGMELLEDSFSRGIRTLVHCRGRPIRSGRFISYFWQKWLGVNPENISGWLQISFPEVYS